MKSKLKFTFKTIDTHTMGEATRIVIDGIPDIKGSTMMEKKQYVQNYYDYIRKLLMFEPRGHKDMFGAIVTEPANEQCDLGVIFMDNGSYLNMCGHGTIGTVTMCIEKGIIPRKETVLVDTPSGVIECKVRYTNEGEIENVTFRNVPAFTLLQQVPIKLSNREVKANIAFGGSFFGIIDAEELGLDIDLNQKNEIINAALEIRDFINREYQIAHPLIPEINKVDLIEISQKVSKNHYKNVVVFGDGQIDRSPCGTGTCAKMATLDLEIGEEIIQESIIGSIFKGKVLDKVNVENYPAIIPMITGAAWITGEHQFILHEADIYPEGFAI